MTTIYSVTPTSGINLNTVVTTNTNSANATVPTIGPLGLQVFTSNGKRAVLAKAGAAIGSAVACSIDASTFVATAATGGTYTSIPGGAASGDYAFFVATSV